MIVCQQCGERLEYPPVDGRCASCGSIALRNDEASGDALHEVTKDPVSDIDATLDEVLGDQTLDAGTATGSAFAPTNTKELSGESALVEQTVAFDKTVIAGPIEQVEVEQVEVEQTVDGSVAGISVEHKAQHSATRVTRGRSSLNQELDQESLNKWTLAAGASVNPLLSLSAQQSFEYDDVPLTNQRRLAADPNDMSADYEIVRAVGKGAMGEVFAARQRSLNRTVALKTISAARCRNPKDQRKFLYEARITSELAHPNIVPVHDLAVGSDGSPFYSMKLVSGKPWQKVIREKSLDENLDIFMKVCDAIGFAHSQSIIHRDLKPENIMLGAFGEVLVMDWGLAIDLRQDKKFDLAGTPAYMSPEMARHDIDLIGTCSDIYLLGAILYQIVTGKAPHPGRSVTECVIAASSNQLIPAPDPDHPLLKIAMVAISTDPEGRYPSVEAFQDAIRNYRRHTESVAQVQRAEMTLQKAIEQDDYESFSRAMFGFGSALELWPENQSAVNGLARARMTYGEAALRRNDFDLALQVLKDDVEAERPLIAAAHAGKLQAQQRVARIRRLTNTIAVGGSIAAMIFLGLSLWAIHEKGKATELAKQEGKLRTIAQEKTVQAQESEAAARESESRALASELKAREALEGEQRARVDLANKNQELNDKNVALDESSKALAASLDTQLELTKSAEMSAAAEKLAREEAVAARLEAEQEQRRAEQARLVAELRNYPANLSLAAIQIRQRDVGRTIDLLNEIEETEHLFASLENGPTTDNWALGRIRLATNQDLPKYEYGGDGGGITSCDWSVGSSEVALGGADGNVELVRWSGNQFELIGRLESQRIGGPAAVAQIALSGKGDFVAFTKRQPEGDVVYFWTPGFDEVKSSWLRGLCVERLKFSKHGQLIACLKGSGLRVWDVSVDGRFESQPRTPRTLSQYQLLDFVSIDAGQPSSILGLVAAGENRYLCLLELNDNGSMKVVRGADGLGPRVNEISAIDGQYLMVGDESGRLRVARILADQLEWITELRADVHRTRITNLAVAEDGKALLSVGLEPVIQLWTRDDAGMQYGFSPSLELVGHKSNALMQVGLMSRQAVSQRETNNTSVAALAAISVDEAGKVLYWDLKRQAERQIIERQHMSAIRYAGGSGVSGIMLTVNAHGVADVCHGIDGSQLESQERYHYVGHTPGAVIQDFSVTPDGRLAITSATIDTNGQMYLSQPNADRLREYCVWDFERQSMLRRWTDARRGFPCVAISPDGKTVAIGGNGEPQETVVIDLQTWKETILLDDKGRGIRADDLAFRPDRNSRLTTVAYGGMVAEFDAHSDYKITYYNREFLDPPTSSSQIVSADWSGGYFAVLFNSGHVRLFGDTVLGELEERRLGAIGNFGTGETRFQRGAMTWKIIETAAGTDGDAGRLQLIIVSRQAAQSHMARWMPDPQGVWQELENRALPDDRWLFADGVNYGTVESSKLERELRVKGLRHVERLTDGKYCVTTTAGSVVRVHEDLKSNKLTLGRSNCIAADGSAVAERLLVAGDEGQLWSCSLDGTRDESREISLRWQALSHPLATVQRIKVSPDGKFVAVVGHNADGTQGLWCYRFANENEITDHQSSAIWVEDAVACSWRPRALSSGLPEKNSELFVVLESGDRSLRRTYQSSDDGSWKMVSEGQLGIEKAGRVQDVVHFGERFADRSRAPKVYQAILVRSEHSMGSEILFLDSQASDAEVPNWKARIKLPSQQVTVLRASDTDGLLATGDEEGAVSIWFLAPSIDQQPFELLSIDRHRGQQISSLAFSSDGSELVSGDVGGRQFVWLAADPLSANIRQREVAIE